jgi:hypothetical protein
MQSQAFRYRVNLLQPGFDQRGFDYTREIKCE